MCILAYIFVAEQLDFEAVWIVGLWLRV